MDVLAQFEVCNMSNFSCRFVQVLPLAALYHTWWDIQDEEKFDLCLL